MAPFFRKRRLDGRQENRLGQRTYRTRIIDTQQINKITEIFYDNVGYVEYVFLSVKPTI